MKEKKLQVLRLIGKPPSVNLLRKMNSRIIIFNLKILLSYKLIHIILEFTM